MSKRFTAIKEGSYGCVGAPSLSCVDDPRLNKVAAGGSVVSKLMNDDKSAKDELKEAKVVQKLDPTRSFTLTPFGMCHANFTGKEPGVSKVCPDRKKDLLYNMRKYGDVAQLISPNGGRDLEDSKAPLSEILPALGSVIKGLIALKRNKVVHTDIKTPNIMYSKERGANLIDFGLQTSNSKNDIYLTWYNQGMLEFSYAAYPPEWDWLARMLSGNAKYYKKDNDKNRDVDNTAHSLIKAVAALCKRPQYHSAKALAALDKGMMAITAPNPKLPLLLAWKEVMLKLSRTDLWTKVDMYGLGISIGELLLERMPNHGLTPEQFYKVTEWIAKATDFNVFTRFTPEEAYSEWTAIWGNKAASKRPMTRAATRRQARSSRSRSSRSRSSRSRSSRSRSSRSRSSRSRSSRSRSSRSSVRKCVKDADLVNKRTLPPYVAGDCKGKVRNGQLSRRRTKYASTPDERRKYYWKPQ